MNVREDFNDDLLMPSKKERRARTKNSALKKFYKEYGAFAFAADLPAFRRFFRSIDAKANCQKVTARWVGILAVLLGWAALMIAAASPVYPHSEEAHTFWSATAISLGLLGAFSAVFGILVVQRDWLRRRYCTERLRQFFFQNMLFRLPQLLAAHKDPAQRDAFERETEIYFHRLKAGDLAISEQRLKAICDGDPDYQADWLLPMLDPGLKLDPAVMNTGTLHADASHFYELYEKLRLNPQKNYADYKLRDGGEIRFQERYFSLAALGTIVLAFLMHFLIAWAISTHRLPQIGAWADVFVLWTAITGLVVKAAEEGLQPKREAERYEDYAANCELAKQRFKSAKDGEQTLNAMLDFERVAYEEMKHFLRTNYRAHFIV